METIIVFRGEGSKGYMAKHSDPETKRLFGTDTIPTAFTAGAKLIDVVAKIQRLNPECRVQGMVTPE